MLIAYSKMPPNNYGQSDRQTDDAEIYLSGRRADIVNRNFASSDVEQKRSSSLDRAECRTHSLQNDNLKCQSRRRRRTERWRGSGGVVRVRSSISCTPLKSPHSTHTHSLDSSFQIKLPEICAIKYSHCCRAFFVQKATSAIE